MKADANPLHTNQPGLPPLVVDSHQDLAWNMQNFGRDYRRSVRITRRLEDGTPIPSQNGDSLLGWPEYQRGRVGVIFATLFAAPARHRLGAWDTQYYTTDAQASARYRSQVDAYHRLVDEAPEKFRLIHSQVDLQAVLAQWAQDRAPDGQITEAERAQGQAADPWTQEAEPQPGHPVGLVLLMEGAEAVRAPAELEEWWGLGVRIIGPAWAGTRFCGGTGEPGPLTADGFALLEAMAAVGFTLDLSHMDEKAALQGLDAFPGQVIASHANALSLLRGADTNRHLTDRVLRGLLERGGVVGVIPNNGFLLPGWKPGDRRELVPLERVAAQLDFICQMAGDASHVGVGSDFDGGFGRQSVPPEIDTIVDLHKLAPLLAERGYQDADIAAILGENWLAFLRRTLPGSA